MYGFEICSEWEVCTLHIAKLIINEFLCRYFLCYVHVSEIYKWLYFHMNIKSTLLKLSMNWNVLFNCYISLKYEHLSLHFPFSINHRQCTNINHPEMISYSTEFPLIDSFFKTNILWNALLHYKFNFDICPFPDKIHIISHT